MPSINQMNPPPNPFWGFVADMQDHPMFGNHPHRPRQPWTADGAGNQAGPSATTNNQEKTQQTTAEDPPEVDPATLREQGQQDREHPCRGRRRCSGPGSDEEGGPRRRGWGHHGRRAWGHPGPFGPGAVPFAGPGGPPPFWTRGPHSPPGGFPFGPGAHGRGGHHHRGGPHRGRGPHGHGPRGPSPPAPPSGAPGGFDLGQFLNDLGSRIGMDLSDAAAGLGLDRFMPSNGNAEVDFEPKIDIFDRPRDYTVHVSLPGAKKSDVGVDWDSEHYALHIAGVVHRPDVDETMLSQLVVDGRKRETGMFEKTIKLGTRRDPAVIDPAGIRARMADGVLVITLPKSERQHEKRDVPIAKSETPSPVREVRDSEKFDADHDHKMNDRDAEEEAEIQLIDLTKEEKTSVEKNKQPEHEGHGKSRESSATVEAEPAPAAEQLPAYHPVDRHEGSDWENFDSDDEGEFVKINVD